MAQFRPTLLVGIGGVGCQIASNVLDMAKKSGMLERCGVAVLGFDTDQNDIDTMVDKKMMDERNLICTSPNRNVWEVLMSYSHNIEKWFVPLDELAVEIRQMSLHNGAGQIRMLSRLAFYSSLKDTALESRLKQTVEDLTKMRGSAGQPVFKGPMNVMFVGTLAGGTGSGMFLQAALYLKKLLEDQGCQPDMRGLFLLPDIMVHAANLPSNQIEPVRANAYAALRELHGILLQTAGRVPIQVQFEYAPNYNLVKHSLPFKNITLIDFENQNGGNLDGGLSTYISLASRGAYELLLTPIGGRADSIGVNDVRSKLDAAGPAKQGDVNYYSALGVAAAVYPTEEILDYLSLQYARRILGEEWLLLDKRFNEEIRRYNERRAARVTSERPPSRSTSYVRDLDQAASEGKPFFADIRSAVHSVTQDRHGNDIREHRHETYLNAIEAEVVRAFWSSGKELEKLKNSPDMQNKKSGGVEALRRTVNEGEMLLRNWKSAIQEALRSRPVEIMRNIFAFSETANPSEMRPYHLQAYIQHSKVHPVEVRYFLYSLLGLIEERRVVLSHERIKTEYTLKALSKKDFDESTENSIETAVEGVAALMQKPSWKRWIHREVQRFGSDYCRYFNQTMKTLRAFAEQTLTESIYHLFEDQLAGERGLLPVYEKFFDALKDLADRLEDEASENLVRHGTRSGPSGGNVYVYADATAKKEMEQRLAGAFGSSLKAGGVNLALVNALYGRYKMERDRNGWDFIPAFDAETLFRNEVIEGYCLQELEKSHSTLYRLSATEAIRREANLKGQDGRKYLESVLDTVSAQSKILLRLKDPNAGDQVIFWGLSPENAQRLGDIDKLLGQTGTSTLVEQDFPDDELLCFSTRVNLTPSDILKLNSGGEERFSVGGIYYASYHRMVDAILKFERLHTRGVSGLFTPHLDKGWHVPGSFPELSPPDTDRVQWHLVDAFALALATGRFERTTLRRKPVTYYLDWTRRGQSDERRLLVKSCDNLQILGSFFNDYPAVSATVDCANDWRERLVSATDPTSSAPSPEESAFFRGLTSAETLFTAAGLCAYQENPSAKDYASKAVKRLYENLKGFLRATEPTLPQGDLIDKVVKIIKNQIEEVQNMEEFKRAPEEVRRQIKDVINGTLDQLKKGWDDELFESVS
ncbi:MAG: tubulin-like doman-containing protein [Desulfatiglandales bacterium]